MSYDMSYDNVCELGSRTSSWSEISKSEIKFDLIDDGKNEP